MQLGLQQRFVGQLGLVGGNERGRQAAAQRVLHHLFVFASAQQHADGGLLVRLFNIAVQRFQVKAEFAQIFGLKAANLQFDGNQAIEAPVKKQQVQRKIAPAHLQWVFAADKAKVPAQFDQKLLELL